MASQNPAAASALDETPFFFGNDGAALFGVLHRPIGTARHESFVFCHPFGEEKLWTHRVFVTFARQLAAAGHTVLRFDHRGNGDSQGVFGDTTLDTARADTRAAIAELRARTGAEAVTLLGLRLGATVASLVAEELPDVHRLILWAPIVDGARYMQDLLRMNVMTQTATFKEVRQDRTELVAALQSGLTVNVDGYEMGLGMYESVSASNLAAAPHSFRGDCLIVQVDSQPKPAPDVQKLASTYARATATFAQEEPFWKEIPRFYQDAPNLFTATMQWLDGREAPVNSPDAAT
jgi:exosortase A-associated hydrolase 2